ncbi:MAG: hypothetical protein CSB24_06345 [Deltaproteobacteria bacterium]|nr:MAG: hypothetical protein CSB24_06345 [Deltaproteobacteria bacterium]
MKKVLVVDDEEDMLWMMQRNLNKGMENVEVLTASSGKEALAMLDGGKFDLVITDIKMPNMNGLELLAAINKTHPKTGIIIMTAYPSRTYENKAMMNGSLRFIEKPFDLGEMRTIIDQYLKDDVKFQGTVDGMDLIDIVQINGLAKATSALRVASGGREGIIFFRDGEVIHAICDNMTGEDAFYKILSCRGGTLQNIKGVESPTVTIERDRESLLLNAAFYADETGGEEEENEDEYQLEFIDEDQIFDAADLGNFADIFDSSDDADEPAGEIDDKIKDILKEFTNIDKILNVYLVNREGDIIASLDTKNVEMEKAGAMLASSTIFSSSSMGGKFDQGNLGKAVFEYENGSTILAMVNENVFMVIVAGSGANIGYIRLAIKNNFGLIREIL